MHRPTPASLRARIAEARVEQQHLAGLLGISAGQLSHILNGHKRIGDEAMYARIAATIESVVAQETAA
jgi:transcriptional regulator with XRE-family HTH domain